MPSNSSLEFITVPGVIFTGPCESLDVTLVLAISDTFPNEGRKNPVNIRTDKIEIDSRYCGSSSDHAFNLRIKKHRNVFTQNIHFV